MPPLDEQLVHDVVKLSKEGMKWRAIARALGISRNTVRQIMTAHENAREEPHVALTVKLRVQRSSKLNKYRARIEELLKIYEDITSQRIFEILRDEGYAGGDNIVKTLVRKLRPKKLPKPSLETPPREPGEMAECDWSEYPMTFTHAPPMKLQAFSYTLRWSTRKYYGFQEGNGLHPLMDEHEHAFERFQGAARRCTYDSQKPVVLRWEGNQPIFNLRFIDFLRISSGGLSPCAQSKTQGREEFLGAYAQLFPRTSLPRPRGSQRPARPVDGHDRGPAAHQANEAAHAHGALRAGAVALAPSAEASLRHRAGTLQAVRHRGLHCLGG